MGGSGTGAAGAGRHFCMGAWRAKTKRPGPSSDLRAPCSHQQQPQGAQPLLERASLWRAFLTGRPAVALEVRSGKQLGSGLQSSPAQQPRPNARAASALPPPCLPASAARPQCSVATAEREEGRRQGKGPLPGSISYRCRRRRRCAASRRLFLLSACSRCLPAPHRAAVLQEVVTSSHGTMSR